MENFESNTAMRDISEFILNDLSRGYIQMTREKENGEIVLECLTTILKLLAPISPFITERIWQNLKKNELVKEKSVHLCSWPEADKKKINKKLEEEFSEASKYIELGMFERDKIKIGLKWPLAKATISGEKKSDKQMNEIIARQLNVRKVEFRESNEKRVELDGKMTPELEAEGYSREFARSVQAERKNKGLRKQQTVNLKVYCSHEMKKMLERNLDFLLVRTNSKKIDFVDDKSMKNKVDFSIKNQKISIELE
jgi:isoleucyl-tRNA synthetase